MKGLILAVLLFPVACVAQSRFYVQGIVGQYSMKGMKEFQEEVNKDINDSGLPAKVVTDFPMSLQIEGGFDKIYDDYSIGGYLNYAFTKGRVAYSDYSGMTTGDQNVSRIVVGGKASSHLEYGFELYGKAGCNYSMLDLDFLTKINGAGSDSETLDFYSIGLSVEPGISWSYAYKKISLSLLGGYELNFQGKTTFKEDKEAYLLNQDGEKVIINWSGMRLGLNLTYKLGSIEEL